MPVLKNTSDSNGFSLMELLVTISVVAVLMAITWPALQRMGDASKNVRCVNNLRTCATAIFAHAQDNSQCLVLPYASAADADLAKFPQLVNHPQQGKAWYEYLISRGYLADRNATLCPAAAPLPENAAWGRAFGMRRSDNTARYTPIRLNSGELASTLLLADSIRPSNNEQWYYITFKGNAVDVIHPRHQKRANALFLDGSVAALTREEIMKADSSWQESAFLPEPTPR